MIGRRADSRLANNKKFVSANGNDRLAGPVNYSFPHTKGRYCCHGYPAIFFPLHFKSLWDDDGS